MCHDNFDWPTIERRSVQLQNENGCNSFLNGMGEKSARGANSSRAAQKPAPLCELSTDGINV
jgi:hypothetical protein